MTHAEDHALSGEILQRLYDSEANGSVRWFWDGGFEWEVEGRTCSDPGLDGQADTLVLACTDMANAASSRYPDSEFARWWKAR